MHVQPFFVRLELYAGPDELGRYAYALYWEADYHPGHPDGEYRHAERGQHFHAPLPAVPVATTIDRREERR